MAFQLYIDEDAMDRHLVQALRARGVDVVTAFEAGMIERSDVEHLQYATAHGRVLYGFNIGDFYQIHSEFLEQGITHAGIVLGQQQQHSVGEQMRRLLRTMADKSSEEMVDQVEFSGVWG